MWTIRYKSLFWRDHVYIANLWFTVWSLYNLIHNQYKIIPKSSITSNKSPQSSLIKNDLFPIFTSSHSSSYSSSSPSYSSSPWPETPSKPQHSPPGWVGSSPFVPLSAGNNGKNNMSHFSLKSPTFFIFCFCFTAFNTFAILVCKTFHIWGLMTRFGLKRLKIVYKEFFVWLFSIFHGKDPMQKLARQLTRERVKAKICPEG